MKNKKKKKKIGKTKNKMNMAKGRIKRETRFDEVRNQKKDTEASADPCLSGVSRL